MTQEDKQLLLKDLSARLPYGVKVQVADYKTPVELSHIDTKNGNGRKPYCFVFSFEPERVKPYLRPLSSMTEEEKKEIEKITNNSFYVNSTYNYITNYKPRTYGDWDGNWHSSYNCYHYPVTNVECNKLISWLDKKHFDHRTDEEGKTLIEKGLANEAPKDMYK